MISWRKRLVVAFFSFAATFGYGNTNLDQVSSYQPSGFSVQDPANTVGQATDQQSLAVSSSELGLSGPFSLGINYNSISNYFLKASYAKQLSHFFAVGGLAEYGPDSYRLGGTLGFKLLSRGLLKFSAEYLNQVLPFSFASGSLNERVGQEAYGINYQYDFANSAAFQDVNATSYYSYTPNVGLSSVNFISNGVNCPGNAGVNCINDRNIAGATAKGLELGTDVNVTTSTQLNMKINYDDVYYHTIFTSSSPHDAAGFGGAFGVTQLLTTQFKAMGQMSVQKIYNTYTAAFSWLPPTLSQLEISLLAERLISHNSVPDSDSLGVEFTLLTSGKKDAAPAHYSLDNHRDSPNLEAYVTVPAVYMETVLATAEQRVRLAGPIVSNIDPPIGATDGDELVTIKGEGFVPDTAAIKQGLKSSNTTATFCGEAASDVSVVNSTTIIARTPPHPVDFCNVTIATGTGTSTLQKGYIYATLLTPTISEISPSSGSTLGGTTVTLTGTHLIGTSSVTFGGTPVSNLTVINDTTITVVTPPHAAGSVDVVVTALGGSTTKTGGYLYVTPVPTLSGVSPSSGTTVGGATVTLTGANLTGASAVTFDGSAASGLTIVNDTTVTVVTPAHTPGAVNVTITTPGGSATLSNGYTYVTPVPTLTGVSPSSGSTEGGSTVTLMGTHLTDASSVTFGGVAASGLTVINDTTVTVISPAHSVGSVTVAVTTPGGSAARPNAYTYSASAPTLSDLSPTSGSTTGGTMVTLTGNHLIGTTSVTFGGSPGTSVTVVNGTTVTVVTPAHLSGSVDVVLTTPGGNATSVRGYTYVAPFPTLSSLSPTSGTTEGGTTVTLTGTNLNETSSVTFGGVSATGVMVVNNTTVTAITPAHSARSVTVGITTAGGSATKSGGYTYVTPAPTLTSLTPTSGTTAGGTSVTLTGTHLTGATSVTFGGSSGSGLTVVNDTTVTVTTPAHAAGAVDVVITTPGGSATSSGGYIYLSPPTLTSITPSSGSSDGGTSVTLRGTHFTGASSVTFGGVAATDLTVVSDSRASVTTPAHSSGSVDVVITTAAGSATSSGGYTYTTPAPTLSSISPSLGTTEGGTPVTLRGNHLTGASSVTFDGISGTDLTVVNNSMVTVTTPAHAAGAVDVVITTPGGSATSTGGYTYVTPAPTLTSLTPTSGTTAGGTSITLTGTHFTGATSVTFGGSSGTSLTVVNDTTVTVVTPSHAAGAVDVVITTAGGSATSTGGYTYVTPAPTLTSLTPTSGTTAGGTSITLTGTHFTGATSVTFGGSSGTSLTVVNDTTVTVVTPSHAAGAVDVVITTPGGSATSTGGYTYVTPAPTLTSLTPTSGTTGGTTTVTLTGTHLTGTTSVTFGGIAATGITVVDDTTVMVSTPAHAAGTVDVVITTPGGSATSTGGYTYSAPSVPTITTVSPTTGSTTGGAQVTLKGTAFTGATSVTFGGVPVAAGDFNIPNDGTINVTNTPAHAAGTVNVVVVTPGGTATKVNGYSYH